MKMIHGEWKGEQLCGNGDCIQFPDKVEQLVGNIKPVIYGPEKKNDARHGSIRKLKTYIPKPERIDEKKNKGRQCEVVINIRSSAGYFRQCKKGKHHCRTQHGGLGTGKNAEQPEHRKYQQQPEKTKLFSFQYPGKHQQAFKINPR